LKGPPGQVCTGLEDGGRDVGQGSIDIARTLYPQGKTSGELTIGPLLLREMHHS
jgi:hypothetical protein